MEAVVAAGCCCCCAPNPENGLAACPKVLCGFVLEPAPPKILPPVDAVDAGKLLNGDVGLAETVVLEMEPNTL